MTDSATIQFQAFEGLDEKRAIPAMDVPIVVSYNVSGTPKTQKTTTGRLGCAQINIPRPEGINQLDLLINFDIYEYLKSKAIPSPAHSTHISSAVSAIHLEFEESTADKSDDPEAHDHMVWRVKVNFSGKASLFHFDKIHAPDSHHLPFMSIALEEAVCGTRTGEGGPFGAVIVRNGEVVARGHNVVTSQLDPTAHAEVCAIRNAARKLGRVDLSDCELYSSCEPCAMCLASICWSGIKQVWFAATSSDAAAAGFDNDEDIYAFLRGQPTKLDVKMDQIDHPETLRVFQETQWTDY